jgi:hypothetical protein
MAAILNVGRQTEMISSTGQNATPTILVQHEKLHHHLFARVLHGQTLPPRECPDALQLFTVE